MASISVNLDDAFARQLEARAKARGVSVQSLVVAALVDEKPLVVALADEKPVVVSFDAFRSGRRSLSSKRPLRG